MATGYKLASSQLPSWHAFCNNGNSYDLDDLTYPLSTSQNYSTGFKVDTEDIGNWRIVQDNLVDALKNDTYKINHYAKDGHRCFILREAVPPLQTFVSRELYIGDDVSNIRLENENNNFYLKYKHSAYVETSLKLSHRTKRICFELIGHGGTSPSADNCKQFTGADKYMYRLYPGAGGGGGAFRGILDFSTGHTFRIATDSNIVALYDNDSNDYVWCYHGGAGGSPASYSDGSYSLGPGGAGGYAIASTSNGNIIPLEFYYGTSGGQGGVQRKYRVDKEWATYQSGGGYTSSRSIPESYIIENRTPYIESRYISPKRD